MYMLNTVATTLRRKPTQAINTLAVPTTTFQMRPLIATPNLKAMKLTK